jgi:hypothetical protein
VKQDSSCTFTSVSSVPATLFWYQSGVIGTTRREIKFHPDPAFKTFEEAEHYFAEHRLVLRVRQKERDLLKRTLIIGKRTTPLLYPSTADGILENAVDVRNEDLYVTGRGFRAGAVVTLYLVDNRSTWYPGDKFTPRATAVVKLQSNQTRFTARLWDRKNARAGAYDIIARVQQVQRPGILQASDILAFNADTGVILYIIINGNIVIQSAGRVRGSPGYFEFSDAFQKGEDVYAAVDPTDVPAMHPGGNYAAYFVVAHQPAAYWDGAAPALNDVSGGPDIHRVKYFCINGTTALVWPTATQPEPIKGYDVIVDFGAVAANDAASYVFDNTYNKGVDFIDGYGAEGFFVYEDPSTTGPYPVGFSVLDQANGITGITDPMGITGPTQNVSMAWARIMYPATVAGMNQPVNPALASYPVALFMHGRHWSNDFDGSGPGLAGDFESNVPDAQRIPSHDGYNYIMQQLASQGIFCISISTHQVQQDLGVWDYNARGRLVLKYLDKLKDWNDNGTDPFGGIFHNHIDLAKIAISGHSRGGEGVVAAEVLNGSWPTHYSIVAVNAMAPTDQDALVRYIPTTAVYYLLLSARDGDVSNFQGMRTYDRAYPQGAMNRKAKTVAWVYGANHNYFNTIWTDTAALGSPNPWAGSTDDDGGLNPKLTAAEQRQIALTTVCAFMRRYLQGIEPYREIFTGRLKPAAMRNDMVYWTYQDENRVALDDFERLPLDKTQNTLMGMNSAPGFTQWDAKHLFEDFGTPSTHPGGLPQDNAFHGDTIGLELTWASPQTYTALLPPGKRDVSAYTYLTFRAAKRPPDPLMAGSNINLNVQVQDAMMHTGTYVIRSDSFDRIPHPCLCMADSTSRILTGVRIPLQVFTRNNSNVDLTQITQITITTEGSGAIAIDDIEFGK